MVLGTICVRSGSKGVPGKNIRQLNGRPLMSYTIDCAKECHLLNDIVFSSESQVYISMARDSGLEKIIVRPENLANDSASKWDVFRHLVQVYEKEQNTTIDAIVDLDVTVPLRNSEDIDRAIHLLNNTSADLVITGYDPERNPYFNMVEEHDDGYSSLVVKNDEPIVRRQDAPKVFSLSPAVFAIKRDTLFSFDHWSQAKIKVSPMPRERAIDIDTELDFYIVEQLLNNG